MKSRLRAFEKGMLILFGLLSGVVLSVIGLVFSAFVYVGLGLVALSLVLMVFIPKGELFDHNTPDYQQMSAGYFQTADVLNDGSQNNQ